MVASRISSLEHEVSHCLALFDGFSVSIRSLVNYLDREQRYRKACIIHSIVSEVIDMVHRFVSPNTLMDGKITSQAETTSTEEDKVLTSMINQIRKCSLTKFHRKSVCLSCCGVACRHSIAIDTPLNWNLVKNCSCLVGLPSKTKLLNEALVRKILPSTYCAEKAASSQAGTSIRSQFHCHRETQTTSLNCNSVEVGLQCHIPRPSSFTQTEFVKTSEMEIQATPELTNARYQVERQEDHFFVQTRQRETDAIRQVGTGSEHMVNESIQCAMMDTSVSIALETSKIPPVEGMLMYAGSINAAEMDKQAGAQSLPSEFIHLKEGAALSIKIESPTKETSKSKSKKKKKKKGKTEDTGNTQSVEESNEVDKWQKDEINNITIIINRIVGSIMHLCIDVASRDAIKSSLGYTMTVLKELSCHMELNQCVTCFLKHTWLRQIEEELTKMSDINDIINRHVTALTEIPAEELAILHTCSIFTEESNKYLNQFLDMFNNSSNCLNCLERDPNNHTLFHEFTISSPVEILEGISEAFPTLINTPTADRMSELRLFLQRQKV